MTSTSIFPNKHLEPPAWLYAPMARLFLSKLLYRRVAADLAGSLPPGARLLDVGAGPGYLLAHLKRQRPDLRLFGVDLDYGMIRRAPFRKAPARGAAPLLLVGDAMALPFPPGAFQQVLATMSLHIWPRRAAGLQEMARVLRPGGRAWIYEMNREAAPAHVKAFAQEARLPYFLIYLGFKLLRGDHALRAADFHAALKEAGLSRGQVRPVHHILWRAEVEKGG